MRLVISFAIMLALALSLQGCGRKGPLTLPQADAAKSAQPAATPATPPAK